MFGHIAAHLSIVHLARLVARKHELVAGPLTGSQFVITVEPFASAPETPVIGVTPAASWTSVAQGPMP